MKKFVKIGMICAGIVAVLGLALMIAGTAMGGTLSSLVEAINANEFVVQTAEWASTVDINHHEIHETWHPEVSLQDHGYAEHNAAHYAAQDYDSARTEESVVTATIDSYMGGHVIGTWDASEVTSIELEFATGNLDVISSYGGAQIVLESMYPYEITEAILLNGCLEIDIDDGNDPILYLLIPENIALDFVKLEADAGTINCQTFSARNLEVDINVGSFYAENLQIDNGLTLDMDAGDLWVYDGYCGMLNISNDMGSVSYNGNVDGDIYLDTDAGNIDVCLNASSDDYNYNLSCDLGTIYLNGNEISGWGKNYTIDNGAHHKVHAQCDVGNISIYLN